MSAFPNSCRVMNYIAKSAVTIRFLFRLIRKPTSIMRTLNMKYDTRSLYYSEYEGLSLKREYMVRH